MLNNNQDIRNQIYFKKQYQHIIQQFWLKYKNIKKKSIWIKKSHRRFFFLENLQCNKVVPYVSFLFLGCLRFHCDSWGMFFVIWVAWMILKKKEVDIYFLFWLLISDIHFFIKCWNCFLMKRIILIKIFQFVFTNWVRTQNHLNHCINISEKFGEVV